MENKDPLGLTLTDPLFEKNQEKFEEATNGLIAGVVDVATLAAGLPQVAIFFNFFRSIYTGVVSYSEIREIEMIVTSFQQIKGLSQKQKEKMAQKIQERGPEFTRKLVFSISKLNSIDKSKIYGNILRALIEEKIDFHDFEETSFTIERSLVHDLQMIHGFGAKLLENSKQTIPPNPKLNEVSEILTQVSRYKILHQYFTKAEISRMVASNLIVETVEVMPLGKLYTNRPRNEDVMQLRREITNTYNIQYFSRAAMCIYLYGFR